MLSKMAMLSRSALPLIAKGSADFALSHCYIVKRNFRGRTYVCEQNVEESTPSLPEEPSTVIQPEENEVVPEETVDMQSIQFDDLCAKQMIDDSNQSPYSDLVRESDNVYRRLSGKEEMHDIPSIERGNVSALSFEDDFFRLEDEMNHQYLEDDVNDTLAEANAENADEQVTFVNQENTKEFFDRILAIDSNAVLTEEEKRRISIVREEKKEEKKEIKRHTWFNFMPAKEKPEGMFGTYSPDQIYSSLVFDLLSRNMDEIYKYEKDDLFLNEEILKHAKLPEPVKAPSIPLYPNFEEYAKWVTFAVNRNGDYSMEEKQKVVDILARLGSLDSEIDESPKTEYKIKKYL